MTARNRGRPYRRRSVGWKTPALVLAGAAVAGAAVGAAPFVVPKGSAATASYDDALDGCRVTDGDTIRCGRERIRLLGIDAPELPGHCASYRTCAPGDSYASSRSLGEAMTGKLTIERIGEDHYGRTLAMVAGDKGDLSCWQLEHDKAIYKSNWDNGYRVARTCPASALAQ